MRSKLKDGSVTLTWEDIRFKTERANINAVVNNIKTYPERVSEKYFEAFRQAAENGAEVMRETIRNSTTKTGEKRAAAGRGEAGRIETGRMLELVGVTVRELTKDRYSMSVGWRRGKPGYAIFQEQGTKSIQAMGALIEANVAILAELDQLKHRKMPTIRSVKFGGE